MSYNPDIAAARREAKRHARETGVSYQASLEAVARLAGASSWPAFVSDPRSLPCREDATSPSRADPSTTAPIPRSRRPLLGPRTIVAVALILFVVMSAWTAWNTWKRATIIGGLNASYGDERSAALKMSVPQVAPDRDAYVAAWRLPGNRRRVYLTYMDWRPVVRGPISDIIEDAWVRLGYEHVYLTGARDHPVFRIEAIVDCRTGNLTRTGGFLADDYVGPAALRKGGAMKPVLISPDKRDTICSQDALDRTHRLEVLSADSFPVLRS